MDANRFDAFTRALTASPSRRRVMRGIVALVLTQAALLDPGTSGARKPKRKIKTNQFGCIDVGGKCYGKDARCCSGVCAGNGKRSKYAARNQGGCSRDDNSCLGSVPCGLGGKCYRTTGKAGFCGDPATCDCDSCQKDADCEAEHGAGAACIVCISGGDDCVGVNGSNGTACVPPASLA